MESLSAPVAGGEQRHAHPRPVGHARAPVLVAGQRVAPAIVPEVVAVGSQLFLAERRRAGHPLAVHAAAIAACAAAVLHAHDLRGKPGAGEGAQDAAVVREIAIVVGGALPDAHGRQVRRLERGHLPLVHGVVRDAVQPDPAVAPRLPGRPLDALVEVLRLAGRPEVDVAGRAPGAARVHAHAGIAVRHPLLGVDDLPVLVLVRRARRHVRVLLHHAPPLVGVEILEVQPLGVGAVGQDHGVAPRGDGPEDVRPHHETVVHRDRHVPIDPHPVANLADGLAHNQVLRMKTGMATSRAGRLLHISAAVDLSNRNWTISVTTASPTSVYSRECAQRRPRRVRPL